MIAFKYISKYLRGQDDKNFCYDIAFTEIIQKTKLSEITCALFITRLLGFCKHHSCHDIRHRKSCKEEFNVSVVSVDSSLYESGEEIHEALVMENLELPGTYEIEHLEIEVYTLVTNITEE